MKNYLLIGNPNVGKTTIYNNLTGKNEKTSNFEGVTLLKKSSEIPNTDITIIDLPGINSFSNSSLIESTVTKTLLSQEYDKIIYVADINNFSRNLYLFLDLLETKQEIILILTMKDLFKGIVHTENLEKIFNVEMFLTSKEKSFKLENSNNQKKYFSFDYGSIIEEAVLEISNNYDEKLNTNVDMKFLALQILLGNTSIQNYFTDIEKIEEIKKSTEEKIFNEGLASSLQGYIFLKKREFIKKVVKENVIQEEYIGENNFFNKYADKLLLHKVGGYLVFAFVMWLVFYISFSFGFLGDYLNQIIGFVANMTSNLLINLNTPEILYSFVIDGVFAGISGVLVFLPQIIILFSLLTLLEGIGYFTRVTVLFENLFNKIGLSAHSLIPLISGLGCNVLSIMATRTIKSEPKRIATIFAAPYISCTARFPVYMIFIEVFFKINKALILLSIYFLGILVALAVAYVIDKIVYKDSSELGIVTLPKYKTVTLKYFYKSIKGKIVGFLNKAGKLIFIGTLLIWIFSNFGISGYVQDIEKSFIYIFAQKITFIFKPLGFGTPEASASLISAFFAKELAVSSMQIQYGTNSISELSSIIQSQYTVASAYSFMIFTLLYIPCISTLGAIYSETNNKKFVFYSVILSLSMGYIFAFISYQLLTFLL